MRTAPTVRATRPASLAAALAAVVSLTLSACAAGPAAGPALAPASPKAEAIPGPRLASLGGIAFQTTPGQAAGQGQSPQRKIIRNARLELEVRNARAIARVLDRGRQLATELGGYVASERDRGLVLKVPADRLDEGLAGLAPLGKVARKSITAQDVTAEYHDLAIRVENARRLKTRLHELLGQTRDVKQILEVEKELARVTEELERYEGQLRLMGHQTRYATIDLTVSEEVRPGPVGWIFKGLYVGTKWLFVWN